MPRHSLTDLQRDVLRAFFAREDRFYLTGGGALVGFHLGHRQTDDLDFFTLDDLLAEGLRALESACHDIGATLERMDEQPYIKRLRVRRGDESLKVDIVREVVEQWFPRKPVIDGVRVDPPAEILANKLCALLNRAEVRDLVDLMLLEQRGYRVEDALPAAMRKDGGLSVEVLAWVLQEFPRLSAADLPEDIAVADLEAYRRALIDRLARMAFPGPR